MTKKKGDSLDLSIILTAHNEGILAHKTMLSVFRAIRKLEENDIKYEILIHIDNGDDETKKYFSRYNKDRRVRIFENNFGDPSQSRNFTVEQARGEYVTCFDADDLLSKNWYIDAYRIVTQDKNNIARFNYMVTFGGDNTIITENTNFKDQEILYFIDSNLYGFPFMCRRELYLESPQRRNIPPYGYEDWQWNLDIMSKGGRNVVVPGAVDFYRQNQLVKASVLSGHSAARSVLSPTEMLSYEYLSSRKDLLGNNMGLKSHKKRYPNLRKWCGEVLYHTFVFLNNYRLFRGLKKLLGIRRSPRINTPDWLIEEWSSINKIEKLTGPSRHTIKGLISWLPNKNVGAAFIRMHYELTAKPDTLFFVPWLIRGGADKVFINTANEISRANPSWSVGVFQTYPAPSLWQDKLDDGVGFVNLAETFSGIEYETQLRLMATFISQNDVKRIIIGNSKFAYDLVLRYKTLIRHLDVKVYAYAFAGIIDVDGVVGGYVHEDLPLIQDVVYKIVTDNSQISQQLQEEHAIDGTKFSTHYQYITNEFDEPKALNGEKIKILWASRMARTKIPEVARSIAAQIDSDKFQIDVYGEIEDGYTKGFFANSNLNYIRRFDGIDDLPTDEYDLFLYTSNTDGMPNMLLEIGSKGLPIIAPNIGGIKDFIRDGDTGILIDDCYDVDGYIAAIEKLSDPELRMKLAKNAQKLLNTEFSKSNWEDGIRKIFDK